MDVTETTTMSETEVQVTAFDFRHPPRLSRSKRANLEAILGRFALATQAFLSSRLRTPMDVVVSGVEQGSCGEYLSTVSSPCAAITFDCRTHRSHAGMVDVGLDVGFYIVDRLLGGSGENANVQRAMTPLEQAIVKGVVEKIFELYREAWQDDLDIALTYEGFESIPEVLAVAGHDETMLVTSLDVRGSPGFEGSLSIAIPIRAFEVFLRESVNVRRVEELSPEERDVIRQRIERSLRASPVTLKARMPQFLLSARDLIRLRPGHVMQTGHHLAVPVEVSVNGATRFRGTVGAIHGHLGVRVVQSLVHEGQAPSVRRPRGRVL